MPSTADPLAAVARLDGVFEAVEAARGSVDALLRDLRVPALRPRVGEVTTEAMRQGAWASSALDGREGPLAQFVAPIVDVVGANSLRLHVELASVAEGWDVAPMQALARLHVLAANGLVPTERLGRPASSGAAARLDGLGELVTSATKAPALVLAAVVHAEVLATAAFGPGSGLVARAASRCVLITRGVDPRAASIPEVGHLELGAHAYSSALSAYRSGAAGGVAGWVAHCAQAVALGARAGRRVAGALRDEQRRDIRR